MHARLKPIGHRFSYRVMSLLIDLDRLDAADRQSPLLGVNGTALYSFNEADHGERDGSRLRIYAQRCEAERGKLFYVSPFIEMAMRYHFRVSPPGKCVKLRILETDREGPLLAATFSGRRCALTTAALLRCFLSLPLVTLKIVAAIHWEALRLWLKRARLVSRPDAAPMNTVLATPRRTDYTEAASPAVGRKPGSREGALVQ